MQIDSSSKPNPPPKQEQKNVPVCHITLSDEKDDRTAKDRYKVCLDGLKKRFEESGGDMKTHKSVVQTLFKILDNIVFKFDDPKVRTLQKKNNTVQNKILAYPEACQFMQVAGFDFSGETITLSIVDKPRIEEGLDAINMHVTDLGGSIKSSNFDPT